MYTGNERQVVGVWVFTAYERPNGIVDVEVTQTVPNREMFKQAKKGISKIGTWARRTLRDGKKCPYSPDNKSNVFGERETSSSDSFSNSQNK